MTWPVTVMIYMNKTLLFLRNYILRGPLQASLIAYISFVLSLSAYAELQPISDSEMSDVTGQAFISVDNYNYAGHEFTRINLGLDIETQINVDTLEMGTYHRWENHPTNASLNGTMCPTCDGSEVGLEKQPSDILVDNFSLGHIDSDTGEISPFKITDPFIEFAKDEEGETTGFRLGFGKSKGWLSGDIKSLTGNVDIAIKDTAAGLGKVAPDCSEGFSCILGFLLKGLGPVILGESELGSDALLVNSDGQPDSIRGSMVGMQSGSALTVDAHGELNFIDKFLLDAMILLTPGRYDASRNGDIIKFHSSGCDILTINLCFPLEDFGSFEIGRDKPEGTDGFFISAQTETVKWAQTFESGPGSNVTTGQITGVGSFFNIPNDGIVVNLEEALRGIDRQRTEYIDRGVGLF